MNHGDRLPSRFPRPGFRRHAFTLIELLVVIAVIAVLVALLFPVFGMVIRKGQQSTSASNLRQWFTAFTAAVGERDGEMPTSGYIGRRMDPADPTAWYNALPRAMSLDPLSNFNPTTVPLLGQRSVWINPVVPSKTAKPGEFIFCYGYNDQLVVPPSGDGGVESPMKMSRLEFPALTVLMGEKADAQPHLNISNVRSYFGSGDPLLDYDNEANFLFCDGHVEAFKRRIFGDGNLTSSENALKQKETSITWLAKYDN